MVQAEPNRAKQPRTYRISGLDLPDVTDNTFANGIKCHIIPTTTEPVCRIDWVFNSGMGSSENPMIPIFTATMLKEGCKGKTSAQIADELDSKGASLTTSVGVYQTVITLVCLRRHVEVLMPLVQQVLFTPSFPSDKLALLVEREKYEFEARQKKVNYVAAQLLREAIYGQNHPYSLHKEPGYYKVSSADLDRFHNRNYRSTNCYIVLSGNADIALSELIEAFFGQEAWNQGSIIKTLRPLFLLSQNYKIKSSFGDSLQTGIAMGAPTVNINDPDYYAVKTLVTALGGYFGSRLNMSIREDKGYTYDIDAKLTSFSDKANFSIHTRTANEVVAEAVCAIKEEVVRIADKKMPASEFETVRNVLINQINRSFENPLYVADSYLALQAKGKDFDFYKNFYDYLNNTNTENLRSAAEQYLQGQMYEVIAGK